LVYLARNYPHSSEEVWRARLDVGAVFIDDRPARADSVLRSGQCVLWRRPPWDEPDAPLIYHLLYEDEDLLAVSKPCGLPTVPGGGFLENTLLSLLRREHPEATPIHRLGRGTSGIVLFARTARARSTLSAALRRNELGRVYRALATGSPAVDFFSIEASIGPVAHARIAAVYAASPEGKRALSRVRVLERRGDQSLLEVAIETGRPHQIRIHLAFAGFPLIGDRLYAAGGGIKDPQVLPGDCGYLLHAQSLRFHHPANGSELEIICSPPPELKTYNETG
jgi:23S rRNA pseudouridine1911/1915/1917 synthase